MIEKAKRDEVSALAGARAEGKAEGKVEGKAEMAHEAICKYLDARFGEASQSLQKKVKRIDDLGILGEIINKIYMVNSLEEARAVIDAAAK
ncbi:MAG: hypothetical protein A4E55_02045 [Pelotomaculum sp. PtaU1.Bin035]|nr:MAG: hypothetical protein A4E55_02045 [Pelotomaculum sp. PtaU1.Bin035]